MDNLNDYIHDPEVQRISSLRNAVIHFQKELAEKVAHHGLKAVMSEKGNMSENEGLHRYHRSHFEVADSLVKVCQSWVDAYDRQLKDLGPKEDVWDDIRKTLGVET